MKKVNFTEIKIQNFLSYGKEVSIPLPDGINIITGHNRDKDDGNGVGKSGVIDAFFFAIYGETLKNLKKEEIVNDLIKKNCKVTLYFNIDDNGTITQYRIERGITPSFCKIFLNDVEKTLSTIPEMNLYISRLFNTPQTVARQTITMGINNTIPFMGLKKNERREFIEGIFRLEIFKIMNKQTKIKYDETFNEYQLVNRSLDETNSNMTAYRERTKAFEASRLEKISTLNLRNIDLQKQIDELQNTVTPIDEDIFTSLNQDYQSKELEVRNYRKNRDDITKRLTDSESQQKYTHKCISEAEKKKQLIEEKLQKYLITDNEFKTKEECDKFIQNSRNVLLDNYKKQIVEIDRDIRDETIKIKQIQEIGSICNTCKRPFSENDITKNQTDITHATENIQTKKNTKNTILQNIIDVTKKIENVETIQKTFIIIDDLKIQLNNLILEIKKYTDQYESSTKDVLLLKTKLESSETELLALETSLQNITNQRNELKTIFERNKFTNAMISTHQKNIIQNKNDITKLENETNEFAKLIDVLQQKLMDYNRQIDTIKEKLAIYDVLKRLLADDAVKSYIIKKFLTVLNERLAYYLLKLDANCTLTFDEYFEDKIINDKKQPCSYDNFSGGERKRIDLACLFAFMDLRRIQGDVSFNLAFFDELLDSALSINCSEKLFEILKERSQSPCNEAAFIVTHKKENLKNNLINNVIYLEKVGGVTKLGKI